MEVPQRFGTGCIPTPPELLNRLATISPKAPSPASAEAAPPAVVDLSPLLSEVKNQGSYDACSAFACCAATEFVPFNQREGQNESERFVWYNTKANDNFGPPTANRGTSIAVAIGQLMRIGSCWESACPTMPNPLAPPPESAYAQASRMKVTNALRVEPNTPEGIKYILRFGWPVIIGFRLAANTLAPTSTGVIQVPRPGEPLIGGHAVLIVGYDDNTQLFKFKNSYGSDWGQQGYGFMPYAYVSDYYTFDLFTIQGQQYTPEGGPGALSIPLSHSITVGPSPNFLSKVNISDGMQPGDIDWAAEMTAPTAAAT